MLQIKNLKIKLNETSDEKSIIENATFDMNKGEIILLEGVNGSGKSSLLNAIFKNPKYNITEGEITLEDKNIIDLDTHEIAREGLYLALQHAPEIAGVSTIKFLYRAYENVNKDESKKSIVELKKYLEEKCDKYNLDKNLLTRDTNVGFSGGEKKQAELLHIFALDPNYIFMDEPDSGVDKDAVNKVYEVINDLAKSGKSILVTSHNTKVENLNITKRYIIKDKIICSQEK
jgi:Fe-S cluster assembly ATP-binding protein